jgi:hypothetical protein
MMRAIDWGLAAVVIIASVVFVSTFVAGAVFILGWAVRLAVSAWAWV